MSWSIQQWAVFTPTLDLGIIGDSPSAARAGGPDGALAIAVVVIGDTSGGWRTGGPDGSVAITLAGDSPSAVRCAGPDGSLTIGTILADTPAGSRSAGPDGAAVIDLALSDTPSAVRVAGPDGAQGSGVTVGPDSPNGARTAGPDGAVAIDLSVTDMPDCARYSGPDGNIAMGITLAGDTASAIRTGGPGGVVFADAGPSITLTDTPSAVRASGPDGVVAIGIVVTGDSPAGTRRAGSDGFLAIGVVLVTDTPSAARAGGPGGFADFLVGGTDTPSGTRLGGPDGAVGIGVPLAADSPNGARTAGPVGGVEIGLGADVVIYDYPATGLYPSLALYPSPTLYPRAPTPDARQIRVGGPAGEVLLAVLPSRPPHIPPRPLTLPDYQLWVADTLTGRMLWELPMQTCSWSQALNDIGTIRVQLAIERTWGALAEQDERDPRTLLREILTGPWRFCLVLRWGTTVVWAGPYISVHRPGPQNVELAGAEIGRWLTKRVLITPGALSAGDPTADTVIGPGTTKPHAAAVLLTQLLQGNGNNLPIMVTDPGGMGTDYRTYYGYDLRDYWQAISQLSQEADGPEVRFDPRVTAQSDGEHLSWTVTIGNPHLGRDVSAWTFDSDVSAVIGFDGDGARVAMRVWSSGSGQSRDKLIAQASDTSPLAIGWPMLEAVDTAHTSETVYPVLAAQAQAQLAAWKQPAVAFQVSVPADRDPMVGTYRVGEDFAIEIHDDPIIPDGLYTRRIAGISGTEKPWVTITDASPLPVGAS